MRRLTSSLRTRKRAWVTRTHPLLPQGWRKDACANVLYCRTWILGVSSCWSHLGADALGNHVCWVSPLFVIGFDCGYLVLHVFWFDWQVWYAIRIATPTFLCILSLKGIKGQLFWGKSISMRLRWKRVLWRVPALRPWSDKCCNYANDTVYR